MNQFEFQITHRQTNRRDQVRATAPTEPDAREAIERYYGDLYLIAASAHSIRPAHAVLGEIDCTGE